MEPLEITKELAKIRELSAFCMQCNACNLVCPTNQIKLFSPRQFIFKLLTEGLENIDNFLKDQDVYKCLTCDLCMRYCPMSSQTDGIKFAEIIRELRTYGLQKKLIGRQLDKNQTHDSIMQLLPKMQSDSEKWVNKIDFITQDSSLIIADSGPLALFLGCVATMDNIFYAHNVKYTDIARCAIKILNKSKVTPVVQEMKCCGHDSYWAGDIETAKKLAKFNVDRMNKAGVKTILTTCAEGYRMWKIEYPKLVENCNFEVKHFTEYLLENKAFRALAPIDNWSIKVTYHDPCRLGRLGGIYDPPRQLIQNLPGVELVEMASNRENSWCCGVPLFLGCNSDTKLIREKRIQEAMDAGADYLVTTCPKCITHFTCYLNELEKKNPDKKFVKVLDLTTFIAKRLGVI